jgi:UDPglucose--hexose-1-phosphate uridylyltransferase
MPQLRQNIVTGEWVVIAPERAKRPTDFIAAETLKPGSKVGCVFCEESEAYKKYNLKGFETRHIYVIPNKFPAFLESPDHVSPRTYKLEDGFYNARPSTGGHDVIIIKEHDWQLFDFTDVVWEGLFSVAKRRYSYWRNDRNTEYSMLIYNQGVKSGASIYHPHAQLFSSNIIPNQISREVYGAQRYFENNGVCVFCDLIHHERREKVRIIKETRDFVAFTFYAARFPFEIWVLPKVHLAHFEDEKQKLMAPLGKLMREVIGMLGKTLQKPPLNFFLHDLPTSIQHADYYHWHLEIAPRVTNYGGYELGSGVVIDVMSPEDAAKYLRGEQ